MYIICFTFCINFVCLETDKLPQLSANVEMARQKMQEVYNKNCALAQIKEEEVLFAIQYNQGWNL
mgnify:CR=1 FL=1